MLLLTCLPDRTGTLGQYFFTEPLGSSSADDPQMQQKLTIIRLADTRYNDLFSAQTVPDSKAAESSGITK